MIFQVSTPKDRHRSRARPYFRRSSLPLANSPTWRCGRRSSPATRQWRSPCWVSRLRQVPDRRAKRGRRYALVVILTLTACATLVVGGDSMTAILQWAARGPQAKLARAGGGRGADGQIVDPVALVEIDDVVGHRVPWALWRPAN
ncbi:transposase family protein [Actinacidiphila soli]|uniref:transposase family protein n=1 Tax=Actinacidiphila soli TaxID=2487275 RepID=UPI000FCCB1AF|nr:transposase family protein [Actinacidiphila soli]